MYRDKAFGPDNRARTRPRSNTGLDLSILERLSESVDNSIFGKKTCDHFEEQSDNMFSSDLR